MQDSGVEWIGTIPQGWRLDRLKDIVSLRDEKSTEKSEIEDYLELEDLEQGTGRLLSVRNTTNVESAVMKFYKGDVLFGKLRPYLRKYHLATFDGKCTGEILAFQPEKIEPKFLLYFIASDGFIKVCTAMSYGAKMPRVNYPKQLALLPVCLPSTQEQQAIAEYLDQQCGKLDAIIAIKQQQIKTLDALRQSVIYQAVTKGLDASVPLVDSGVEWLGKIPQGWKAERIGNISLKIGSGVTPKGGATVYEESGIPLFRSQNIHFSGLKINEVVFISEETHQEMKGSQVKANDVLLNITGASIGRCFYFSENCIFKEANVNQHVCIIRLNHQALTKFVYYFLSSDIGQSQIFSSFRGASREGLNFRDIKLIKLSLPSVTEQQSIINRLDQETQRLTALKANLNQQISTLEAYKKSLIYECVTGKKRINRL